MNTENLFSHIPEAAENELFEDIVKGAQVRIERIVSFGQSSPASGWYDQEQNEWVVVLRGCGVLEFVDGRIVHLNVGDHINIPARQKHKVLATSLEEPTVWLAVFY
ncbi:cupin domain-containing protein [Vibrio sp. WXL210]|uniref:cupin domain-containing protein n=1 Tax=Vibrio sp. WXL210 TaxID=3450709 RepID=UPI003EC5A6F6